MSKAHVTPEEIRRFASYLNKFNINLEENFSNLSNHLHDLGTTWLDQEYIRFDNELKLTSKQIIQFLAISKEMVPFLVRKAKAAEDYLNMR